MKKIALAVVGLAVAASVCACGNNKAAPAASPDPPVDSTSQAPPPTPTIDPVLDTDPTGVWNLRGTTVKSNNTTFAKVGAKSTSTWTFHPSCHQARTCGGRIRSSSGHTFTYDWNGRMITVHVKPIVTEGPCTNGDGTKAVGTHFKQVDTTPDVRLVKHGKTYVGLAHASAKVSELKGCSNSYADTGSPSPSATQRWVMSEKK